MPSSHLILCGPLLLLPPIPPSIRVFSNESTLRMRWPEYWSFSFSIIPTKEIPGLISAPYLIHRRRQWQPTPVLLPGKSHGQRSLVGCSPWGRNRTRLSDFTFTFHFHALGREMATHSSVLAWRIPWTGKPGGLPLSRTRLKRLSTSSSNA